jgi:hypothetical protein
MRPSITEVEVDVLSDHTPQHPFHSRDDARQVDHLRREDLLSAEHEQVSRERSGSPPRAAYLLDIRPAGIHRPYAIAEEFPGGEDDR